MLNEKCDNFITDVYEETGGDFWFDFFNNIYLNGGNPDEGSDCIIPHIRKLNIDKIDGRAEMIKHLFSELFDNNIIALHSINDCPICSYMEIMMLKDKFNFTTISPIVYYCHRTYLDYLENGIIELMYFILNDEDNKAAQTDLYNQIIEIAKRVGYIINKKCDNDRIQLIVPGSRAEKVFFKDKTSDLIYP